MIKFWKEKTRALKSETIALYYASGDPRLPWAARLWVAFLVAYAFSPIDLIPDFITQRTYCQMGTFNIEYEQDLTSQQGGMRVILGVDPHPKVTAFSFF